MSGVDNNNISYQPRDNNLTREYALQSDNVSCEYKASSWQQNLCTGEVRYQQQHKIRPLLCHLCVTKSAELNPVRHWRNKSKILVESHKMQPH